MEVIDFMKRSNNKIIYEEPVVGDSSGKKLYREYLKGTNGLFSLGMLKIVFPDSKSDEIFITNSINDSLKQDSIYTEINNVLIKNVLFRNHLPMIHYHDKFKRSILVDDLGIDSLYITKCHHPSPIYLKLLDILVEFYNFTKALSDNCIIKKRIYDKLAMEQELEELYSILKTNSEKEIVKSFFKTHIECVTEQPLTICHRDFQSKNIMLLNKKPYIIDIQDMCLGPMIYDLVTLLFDNKINVDDSSRNYYINYFISKLKNNAIDPLQLNKWIVSTNIIRLAKSAGRHYKIYEDTGREESLNRHKTALNALMRLIPNLAPFFNKN